MTSKMFHDSDKMIRLIKVLKYKPNMFSENKIEKNIAEKYYYYMSYKKDFRKWIYDNRPDWIIDRTEETKQKILNLKVKPRMPSLLGHALNRYIGKNRECYDEKFRKEVMKKHPDWFIDTKALTQSKILKLKHRPKNSDNELYSSYQHYISDDKEFLVKVYRLHPTWLANCKKKLNVLKMLGEI